MDTLGKEPLELIAPGQYEIHVNKKRRLSVRECAILQTFPDDFIFEGSLHSMIKQIGNMPFLNGNMHFKWKYAFSIWKILF